MKIQDADHLAVSRRKLRRLEDLYQELLRKPEPNPQTQQVSLRTVRRLINEFTEEIVRFELRAKAPVKNT